LTRPLFLVPGLAGVAAGSALRLDGDEGRHAAAVRRIRAGERIDVADGAGTVAGCLVTAASKADLDLRVESVSRTPEPVPRLGLVQALAKGGRDEQAVETATEVGVDVIVPWQAARSVVRWQGERGEKARRRWESTAREAAKQSRRARVPQVADLLDTAGVARLAAGARVVVLHEDASTPLPDLLRDPSGLATAGDLYLVVGPEGGIGDDELAVLTGAGALAARLGPEVLRASTAGPVALAVLAAGLGRWN
jgi:16S rRNA (uracil1498-N3)-methyltransferase